jgi:hypothetical protein
VRTPSPRARAPARRPPPTALLTAATPSARRKHTVIIALGVLQDGTKMPLGVWCGATENHVVGAGLLQNKTVHNPDASRIWIVHETGGDHPVIMCDVAMLQTTRAQCVRWPDPRARATAAANINAPVSQLDVVR